MKPLIYDPLNDAIFKYLMNDDLVRNELLGVIIGEKIHQSKLLDHSLNPLVSYKELRSLVNHSDIADMMEKFSALTKEQHARPARDPQVAAIYREAYDFVLKLSPLYFELMSVLPLPERQTQLDVICETDTGFITIEVQVQPQNYWDLRILDHVCGLFHRQFGRGFRWSQLEDDWMVAHKIKRVIGVSLFAQAPQQPERIQNLVPWYNAAAWDKDEISRHFRIADVNDSSKVRPGIEFFDVNLAAFLKLFKENKLDSCSLDMQEWLKFLSSFKLQHTDRNKTHSAALKRAYELIEYVPQTVDDLYKEALARQANISHYVEAVQENSYVQGVEQGIKQGLKQGVEQGLKQGVEQGIKQGVEQGIKQGVEQGIKQGVENTKYDIARKLKAQKITTESIVLVTGLDLETIEKL